ncbi:3-oxoacyl-[acyl-carrier-protein] synthase III C-terminal domain-containing protein [Sorangium sp. So ce1182]|uniref:3-oxoacyl-[acyl-carrier-protein] synthase III C-terminal domain-containing protein n=1 Tax=Sorangium sp. So ce1182 TaxID=3133334 RepID=UPI003F5D7669
MKFTIGAIATFLPEPSYTTDCLLDASGGKLSPDLRAMLRRLGVEQRHSILSNYPQVLFEGATPEYSVRGTEMAVRAARGCLAKARCDAKDLGLVIAATNTPSRLVPGLVSDLFAQMAELPREAMNLSLQGQGCSPLLKAVDAARWYLQANPERRALIVCMESTTAMSQPLTAPRYLSFKEACAPDEVQRTVDVLHGFLFADGAVALLLQADGPGPAFGPTTHLTNDQPLDAELGHIVGAGSDMPAIQGRPVYKLGPGITERGTFYALDTVQRLLAHPECPIRAADEADQVLIHTGSRKILDGICGRLQLGCGGQQVASSYEVLARYGNLTGASLGFMLADALPRARGPMLLVSFGLSFSGSAGILFPPAEARVA